jgi:hypothetical protein
MMKTKMKNYNEYYFLPVINVKLSSITLNFNEVSNNVHFFYRFADGRWNFYGIAAGRGILNHD